MALKINFAIVDFPEPDCPAIAKISPFFREKFTASAATTSFESDEKKFFF